jgi:hypothetical protein
VIARVGQASCAWALIVMVADRTAAASGSPAAASSLRRDAQAGRAGWEVRDFMGLLRTKALDAQAIKPGLHHFSV